MTWFSIAIEAEGRLEDADDNIDRWVDILEGLPEIAGAVASWGGVAGGPGAHFSLEARDVGSAVTRSVELFEKGLIELNHDGSIAHLEISTEDYLDAWLERPGPNHVGLAEVAELLAVSKQRVFQLRGRPDFPKPMVELASGPVWTRDSLNHFLEGWERRPGRPAGRRRSRRGPTSAARDGA
jgi:hypothetical protein